MSALEADQTVADESISEAQLSETYGPLQQQVADSVAQQQTLIESINVCDIDIMMILFLVSKSF